jgi:hypothetical protein
MLRAPRGVRNARLEENCRRRRVPPTFAQYQLLPGPIFALPFPSFAVGGIFKLLSQQWVVGAECIGIALGALLMSRGRLVLFLGAVGFCAVRFLIAIALTHDWRAYVGLLISGILLVMFRRFAKHYKPSYGWPEGSIVEFVVGLSSLLLTLRAFILIDR